MRTALLPLFALLLLPACIERAWDQSAVARRPQVDREQVRDLLRAPPSDAVPVAANFNDQVELVAWKMEPAMLIPGQRTTVTLYWKCLAELGPWRVFVHLDDVAGTGSRIHAEHDPAQGRFPTDAWKPGDTVADSFSFTAGRDSLYLYVGFYSEGENRLPLVGAGRGRDEGQNRLLAGVLPAAK